MTEPLVSCLCITEGRAAFMPWLLWNFDKQTYAQRELVVIDSSERPLEVADRPGVRVIRTAKGTNVPTKRNLALDHANGSVIAWFDDDDWQHPERLALLVHALSDDTVIAGGRHSWFVDVAAGRAVSYKAGRGVIFNGAAFSTEAARTVRFDPRRHRGSDTVWMAALGKRFRAGIRDVGDAPLSLWLSHQRNLSNPAKRRRFPEPLDRLRAVVGDAAWADTEEQLDRLRERLGSAPNPSAVASVPAHQPPLAEPVPRESGPVSAMIKATVLDAPYLGVMVPHMLRQMRHPLADRYVVVDRRPEFTGKYAGRPRATRAELDRVLDQLVASGAVDRIVEVDDSRERVAETMRRYFGSSDVPTHASSGGPIHPTLFGLDVANTDHVVQMDADVFFHASGGSWVAEGLERLARDPSTWLVMTFAGPPAGAVTSPASLGPLNRRRARWDKRHGAWCFGTASTRYFLTDRRRLHGRLVAVRRGREVLPLEQCISLGMRTHGAHRLNLALVGSWDLHAHFHGEPFPEWAERLAAAVEQGRFPRVQSGTYDLRLDHAPCRRAWAALLGVDRPTRTLAAPAPRSPPTLAPGASATTPLSVVIPVRDRAGARLENALVSLCWQDAGRPTELLVVSHGSRPEINAELERLCARYSARLLRIGSPTEPWCKPLAMNSAIRASSTGARYLMTMDADMILAPSFLRAALDVLARKPRSLVLCQSSDLPRNARLPERPADLLGSFERLRRSARRRGKHGTGGIQLAERQFFFDVRGYDEDLVWWGAEDGDMVARARRAGLELVWIDDRTSMLHQWHPKRHAALTDPRRRAEAGAAWSRNHALVRARQTVVRNPNQWGGGP